MSGQAAARLRTAVTIVVLGLLLLGGVGWAWAAVTKPFPEGAEQDGETPLCVNTQVAKGEVLRPRDVTVSVINAGDREGFADQTQQQLIDAGFGAGDVDNAPDGAGVLRAQIWTSDKTSPAVLLIRTYLGPKTPIVDRDTDQPGITVVVGDGFKTLQEGQAQIKAGTAATVCEPTPGQ